MALGTFHPLVRAWFEENHQAPTPVQEQAWPLIARGDDVLVIAPTGSGKTLTGFLGALSELYGLPPAPSSGVKMLYISPLKALSNDIEKNLKRPLAAIEDLARERGVPLPSITIRQGRSPGRRADRLARARVSKRRPRRLSAPRFPSSAKTSN